MFEARFQTFEDVSERAQSAARVGALRAELARRGRSIPLQSDGGINLETIADFAAAGVELFVLGSGIFGAGDYRQLIPRLRAEIARGQSRR